MRKKLVHMPMIGNKEVDDVEGSVTDLEQHVKALEDNIVLSQQLILDMKQKHNELVDLLQKKKVI